MSADLDEGVEMLASQSRHVADHDGAAFERVDTDGVNVTEATSDDGSGGGDDGDDVGLLRKPEEEKDDDTKAHEALAAVGKSKRKRKKGVRLSKREKLKMTFFWILLCVVVVQLIAIGGVVVTYEAALDVISITEPKWLAWDIAPGAFSGCRSLPPQLYGSFGPTQLFFWNITSGKPQEITEAIAGPALAGDWLIDEIIGTPNGVTLIRWAEDGFNQGVTSVECATAWGTWDLNYGWENGIIYNFTGNNFVYFGHIWRRTAEFFEIWEVADFDLSYHIDSMRDAIEGNYPDYPLASQLRYLKAPLYSTADKPGRGISPPPMHKWCWNYDDCDKYLQTTDEVKECWDSGVCSGTSGDHSLDIRT